MLLRSVHIAAEDAHEGWPFTIPAIAHIVDEPLEFTSSLVVIVGENGSGKSTLLDAIADAYGLDNRGGHGDRRYASSQPRTPLGERLQLRFATPIPPKRRPGFYLRAQNARTTFEEMARWEVPGYASPDRVSHGESYLEVLSGRFTQPGLYLLDEAEGPLSFGSTLQLMYRLRELAALADSHVIYTTHSPMIAALPGAQVIELDEHGYMTTRWDDLTMTALWRRFLDRPDLFFEA